VKNLTYKIIFSVSALASMGASAQMSSRIDQFFLDPSIVNPAAMSLQKKANVSMYFNRVYSGIQGAPENLLTNVVLPLSNERATFGLFYLRERAGFSNLQNAYASYAYDIPFNEKAGLSLGVSAGFMNQSFDPNRAVYIDPNDQVIQGLLFSPAVTRADVRASALFHAGGFYGGLSMSRLARPRFDYSYFTYKASYNLQNIGTLVLGYDAKVGENFHIKPAVMASAWDFDYYRVQGNLTFSYADKFWGGVTANDLGRIGFNAGVGLGGGTRVGYAYTIPSGGSKDIVGNGHEFFLSIGLGSLKAGGEMAAKEEESTDVKDEERYSEFARKKIPTTVGGITDIKNAGWDIDTAYITVSSVESSSATEPGFYLVTSMNSNQLVADNAIKALYLKKIAAFKFQDKKNNSYYVYVKYFKTRNEADRFLLSNDTGLEQAWIREVK
jgi:type IX secretion system PorP/SprF family membrane protein